MGTRGTFGFVVDETEKLTYNHFDSYPGGLGLEVLGWLRKQDVEKVREAARTLRLVNNDEPATDADIASVGTKYADVGVSTGDLHEWYVLLRETQGNPEAVLDAGVMIDGGSEFALDSLFCEYGYVVDLDQNVFEVYAGFQEQGHNDGRFAKGTPARSGYYPIRLVRSWSLSELPTDDEFMSELDHL